MNAEDFKVEVQAIVARYEGDREDIDNEEQTKNSLIRPFFEALGYDFLNPKEVKSEDIVNKLKVDQYRVDYSIKKDGVFVFIVECKGVGFTFLEIYDKGTKKELACFDQLKSYYDKLEQQNLVGILTDGLRYQFFFDWEEERRNRLRREPFLDFRIDGLDGDLLNSVFLFHKEVLDPSKIRETVKLLLTVQESKKKISELLSAFERAPVDDVFSDKELERIRFVLDVYKDEFSEGNFRATKNKARIVLWHRSKVFCMFNNGGSYTMYLRPELLNASIHLASLDDIKNKYREKVLNAVREVSKKRRRQVT
jgi:hypothetical protein